MKNIKEAQFLKPIRSDPSQRDPNLWCEYYGTHDHETRDCRHLREEVATLLKNGHLRELLSDRTKNNYGSSKKTKVSVTHSKRLREFAEDDITFTEEDADRLLLPHNDAHVISLNVLDLKNKGILVDPGSSTNIIQWRVLEQAKLTGSIILATKLLTGFNLASVTTRGEILLPTNAKGVTKSTLFEVVDGDIGYNIILGRPWLHDMKAIPSTYHQLLKFPTLE
uniref:Retrotransposon gag protein n=1 Tax=Nicotiana tabacum TaxID=4097 RepID=A0A1S4C6R7_TOBAC|nr:uncharacterized protein LOC104093561 [Nicotiana tomentosiformis]XP_016496920.1 PREDICTED: uncharacterized protein LOC107815801 [Nicotiana tabacum]